MEDAVRIENLRITFRGYEGAVYAVRGVSFQVKRGEVLALVGESGSGKSVTAQALLKLNDRLHVETKATQLFLGDLDVMTATEKQMEETRGSLVGMVFQDPMSCLNPTMKIGDQVTEGLYRRKIMGAVACKREAVRLLELVGIHEPKLRCEQYPHQFSGGMRQRIMIAMALAGNPNLLIADEPTTALDVKTQQQILQLISDLRKELGLAVLLITHDFGVVKYLADRVAVMYAGKIVEEGRTNDIWDKAAHPYTQALLESLYLPPPGEKLSCIQGSPPDLSVVQKGCAFAERCEFRKGICTEKEPERIQLDQEHHVSCWKAFEEGGR